MRVPRGIVRAVLFGFLVVLIFNLIMSQVGVFSLWMGFLLELCVLGVVFLVFRKFLSGKWLWIVLIVCAVLVFNIGALMMGIYNIWMDVLWVLLILGLLGYLVYKKKWTGKVIAFGIPLAILLYVLYWNVLPFGYSEEIVLDVGTAGDTDEGNTFYIVDNEDLGPAKMEDGVYFRELNGRTDAVFDTKAVLKNATVEVSVEGDGVYLFAPKPFEPTEYTWDYIFNFEHGIPAMLEGDAVWKEGCGAYFDGNSSLYLPDSEDMFEDGPFSVYVEWTPMKDNESGQIIVGHYNWGILQNIDGISAYVGRMNDAEGKTYTIRTDGNILKSMQNDVLFVYAPSENGYIQLFVNGNFINQKTIGEDKIWADYNTFRSLSLNKFPGDKQNDFVGCIERVLISEDVISVFSNNTKYSVDAPILSMPLIGNGKLFSLNIGVVQ